VGHVPSPRLQVPGRRCEGQSQLGRSARPAVSPRHVPNHRRPRRTRRSVRPATCRVSDRTMVRVVRPRRFEDVQRTRSRNKGTVRKKTGPSTRKHSKASSCDKSGLTAKRKKPKQSEGTESALLRNSGEAPPRFSRYLRPAGPFNGLTVALIERPAHHLRPPPCRRPSGQANAETA